MKFLERAWYSNTAWLRLLWPLHWLFLQLAARRRARLSRAAVASSVPVVIIGNISVGGTGKTPLLIALVKHLQSKGQRVGVVSRGYGSRAEAFPVHVSSGTAVDEAGDEALIIARHCGCPLVIDPDRVAAVTALVAAYPVDVILSDDGLQHYAMARDLEVIVVDGERRFGNGLCLPAGPLREPLARLGEASLVAVNGSKSAIAQLRDTLLSHGVVWASSGVDADELRRVGAQDDAMSVDYAEGFGIRVEADSFVNLLSGEKRPYAGAPFKMGSRLQAVCGLGNPSRFYGLLKKLPHLVTEHSFPDHHWFREGDFEGFDAIHPVVMTEKDAVKVAPFAEKNYWYLSIKVKLPERFLAAFDRRLADAQRVRATAATGGAPSTKELNRGIEE